MNDLRRFAAFFLMMLCASAAAGGETQDWAGEWGYWLAVKTGKQYGRSLEIFQCDEESSTCRVNLDVETPVARCSTNVGQSSQLRIVAPGVATLQMLNTGGGAAQCVLDLRLTGSGPSRQIEITKSSGSECGFFCTDPYRTDFNGLFPWRTAAIYPHVFSRGCFADPRKSRELWCTDPSVRKLDETLVATAERIDDLNDDRRTYAEVKTLWADMLSECEPKKNVAGCLRDAYARNIAALGEREKAVRQAHHEKEKNLSMPGDPAAASALIAKIDGVYKKSFENGFVDGRTFESEDVLEIVRVTESVIFFRALLEFYNGHICAASGMARFQKTGTFVFDDPEEPLEEGGPHCRLELIVDDATIRFSDTDNLCKQLHCGMRGGFNAKEFPRQARQPLRDLEQLKNSPEYKEALEELGSH